MQVPHIMRQVNRAVTNPLMNLFAGFVPPLAIVHHVGRRSGRRYRTPVVAFPSDRGYVTPLPYGTDTDWCLNVLEADLCTLDSAGRHIEVANARIVPTATALKHFPAALRPGLRLADLPGYLLLDRKEPKRRKR